MSTVIGNLGNALELTIPVRADNNWDAVMQAALLAITTHNHDGLQNGAQISIGALSITNAQLALMNANTVKMNNTGSSAAPQDVTTTNAFVALFETKATTLGDLIYGGASGVPTRLAGDTSNTRKFLRELSSGGVAAAPAWDTLVDADVPGGSANTASTILKRDANKNALINTIAEGFTTTVTSATPIVLTNASTPIQELTGTTAQTLTLPDATTLAVGWPFTILNKSTAITTVKTNGAATLFTLPAGGTLQLYAVTVGVAAGTWDTGLLSGQGQLLGTATNDSAAAGNVGEVISQLVTAASPVTGFSTTNAKNIATITLTAGDWDISCLASAENTTTSDTITSLQIGIGTTTGTLPTDDGGNMAYATSGLTVTDPGIFSQTIPHYRVSLTGSQQYWLVGKYTFAAGAVSAWGNIRARRIR